MLLETAHSKFIIFGSCAKNHGGRARPELGVRSSRRWRPQQAVATPAGGVPAAAGHWWRLSPTAPAPATPSGATASATPSGARPRRQVIGGGCLRRLSPIFIAAVARLGGLRTRRCMRCFFHADMEGRRMERFHGAFHPDHPKQIDSVSTNPS